MGFSLKGERRNAARFGVGSVWHVVDADSSFDELVLGEWRLHIASLICEGHKSRVWGSNYWREWLDALDLCDDGFEEADVRVADVDDDVDQDGDAFVCGFCEDGCEAISTTPWCLL